ncbi:MAG: hypothetical protein QOH70_2951 [Blastocatellia bacterium]|jgi:hypothetical protein|nr:hypothetical protein [Blastocatellia bacterium]
MKGKPCRRIVCAAVILLTFVVSVAQSAPDERPKLKDFGSSLKHLKWEADKLAAVEIKRSTKPGEANDDDVVRVENETSCFPERL